MGPSLGVEVEFDELEGRGRLPPQPHGPAPAATVHTPEYIDFLQIAAREWAKLPGSSPEVICTSLSLPWPTVTLRRSKPSGVRTAQ